MSTPAPYENNAAGRLVDVFNLVLISDNNEQIGKMWWRILRLDRVFNTAELPNKQIPDDRYGLLYERLVGLNHSLNKVESQIRELLPDRVDVIPDEFPVFREVLAPKALEQPRVSYGKALTKSVVKLLGLVAKELPLEGNITTEEFAEIHNALYMLKADIQQLVPYFEQPGYSGKDVTEAQRTLFQQNFQSFKSWLLKMVDLMIQAMANYPFCGNAPLEEATAQILGQMILQRKMFNRMQAVYPPIYQQLLQILDKVKDVSTRTAVRVSPLLLTVGSFVGVEGGKELIKIGVHQAIDPPPSTIIHNIINTNDADLTAPNEQPKEAEDDPTSDAYLTK